MKLLALALAVLAMLVIAMILLVVDDRVGIDHLETDGAGPPPTTAEAEVARRETRDDGTSLEIENVAPATTPPAAIAMVLGRAVAAGTGGAVAGAAVVVTHDGVEREEGRTDGTGAFRLGLAIDRSTTLRVVLGEARSRAVRLADLPLAPELDVGDLVLRLGHGIGGRVLFAGGAPASGARVDLLDLDAARARDHDAVVEALLAGAGAGASATAVADADGRFRFDDVDDGAFVLRASRPGSPIALSPALHVEAAAATPLVDVVLEVGAAVRGRVLDAASRAPIAGAAIAALHSHLPFSRGSTRCDEQGRFELMLGITADRTVLVRAPGRSPRRFVLDAQGPEEPELELLVGASPAIAGRIFDAETGKGLAGVAVTYSTPGPLPAIETTSDGDGGFEIAAAGPEAGFLWFRHDGYALVRNEKTETAGELDMMPVPAAPADGRRASIEVPMARLATVRGRVVDAVTGAPIAGARVRGAPSFYAAATMGHDEGVLTAADGTFELMAVAPGAVFLDARHPDYVPPRILTTFEQRTSGYVGVPDLVVRAAERVEGAEIRIRRGRALRGRVTTSEGAPVAGAQLELKPGGAPFDFTGVDPENVRHAGLDGTFAFSPQDPTLKLRLRASHPDHATTERLIEAGPRPLDVELVLVERPSYVLVGRLVMPDGAPAAHVPLEIRRAGDREVGSRVVTGEDGAFRCDELVHPDVSISLFDGAKYRDGRAKPLGGRIEGGERMAALVPNQETRVEIRLSPAATLAGRVVMPDGSTPAAHAVVVIAGSDAVPEQRAATDWRGHFDVQVDDAPVLRVSAFQPGGSAEAEAGLRSRPEEVAAGARDLVIVLEAADHGD